MVLVFNNNNKKKQMKFTSNTFFPVAYIISFKIFIVLLMKIKIILTTKKNNTLHENHQNSNNFWVPLQQAPIKG